MVLGVRPDPSGSSEWDSNGNPFEKRLEKIARAKGNGRKIYHKCS
jgi:hypothetical protein